MTDERKRPVFFPGLLLDLMTYRFLCCSDTHGQAPPPLDETGATAWLHAGNVYDGWTAGPVQPRNPFDEIPFPDLASWEHCVGVGAWLRRTIPVYAVRGNHDLNDLHGFFWNCDDVTSTVRRVGEQLLVAGVGWSGEQFSDLPTDGDLRGACDVVAREVERLTRDGDQLIVLSHYPASFLPADRGYGSLHELVFDLGPVALVAGHLPEWFGRTERMDVIGGQTLAIHPGPLGGLLTIDSQHRSPLWYPAKVRKAG